MINKGHVNSASHMLVLDGKDSLGFEMVPIGDKQHRHHKKGSLNVQDIENHLEDLQNLKQDGKFWKFLSGDKIELPAEFDMSF